MFHTNYIAPGSLEELLTALHQYSGEARVIAGGTDLIPQMRLGKITPRVLIDPHHLPLSEIAETNEGFHLGALVTHTQTLTSPLLMHAYPALVNACRSVGGPPVRNRGTLVGNLANASPAADSALPLLVYDAQVVASRLDAAEIARHYHRSASLPGSDHGVVHCLVAAERAVVSTTLTSVSTNFSVARAISA